MGLLIKGGEIVTAETRTRGDIYIEDETIAAIGPGLDAPPGTEVIDATGKLIFPGFIDPHVHIHLPFMATFAKDTHATASIAALIGGTTTFIEMSALRAMRTRWRATTLWKQKAEGNSACDYAFHMAVTRYDDKTEAQLREIVADGTASFKIFLAYKNFFGVTDEEMYQHAHAGGEAGRDHDRALRECGAGRPVAATAAGEGKTGPEWHEPSRPEAVEAEGTTPLRHISGTDRRNRLRGPSLLRAGTARRCRRQNCAASSYTSNRCSRTSCSTRVMPSAPAWKA